MAVASLQENGSKSVDLSKQNIRDQVYSILKDRMYRGEIGPEDRLVDHEIAAQMNISRMPVREALDVMLRSYLDSLTYDRRLLLAGAVAAYAFSPIDLIPDFIPVLGLLDDLLIVPLGVWAVLKLVPAPLLAEYREEAARLAEQPVSRRAAAIIIALWIAAIALGAWLIAR